MIAYGVVMFFAVVSKWSHDRNPTGGSLKHASAVPSALVAKYIPKPFPKGILILRIRYAYCLCTIMDWYITVFVRTYRLGQISFGSASPMHGDCKNQDALRTEYDTRREDEDRIWINL